MLTMPKGVKIEELKIGDGRTALRNTTVRVRYDGYLTQGDVFQMGQECTFDLWRRHVVAGLRYGVEGMREGGRRRIRVSPHLAYGEAGIPGLIPDNAVLIFEIELLEIMSSRLAEQKVELPEKGLEEEGNAATSVDALDKPHSA